MIIVGLDDTDVLDSPGTNKLAYHLIHELAPGWRATLSTRHQLLEDPRVPCTRKNGCVAILFADAPADTRAELVRRLCPIIREWCPPGSDPGLCVTDSVPEAVIEFGRRCQRELVS